jgi:4-carboxymuconolactone decarboxylase
MWHYLSGIYGGEWAGTSLIGENRAGLRFRSFSEEAVMGVSKGVGVVLLAGIVGVLSAGMMHAQNAAGGADLAEAPLPKDIYPDSRNRLPLPKLDTPQPKARLAVGIEEPGVRWYDPELAKLTGQASRKYDIGLNDQLLEIAVLVAAREKDCQYEWTQWETHGRDPKDPRLLDPAIIDVIKYEKPVTGLGEKEAAIITFGRETFGQRKVSPATFAEVQRLFGTKGTVDLFWLMAGYSSSAAELAAFDNHLRADQTPLMPPRPHPFDAVRKANLAASIAEASRPLPKDVYADSRNRLPLPKREDMDDDGKKVFDQLNMPERLTVSDPMTKRTVRLYSPRLAGAEDGVMRHLRYDTGLSDRLLEIAVLVAAREMDSQYVWTEWENYGRDPNDPRHIEPAVIDMIKYRKPVAGLGEKETAIINLGREMLGQGKVSSETFAETLRLFDRKGVVDVVWVMASYSAAAAELTAFDQHLPAGQKPLLPAL